jgi:hypothetical protein
MLVMWLLQRRRLERTADNPSHDRSAIAALVGRVVIAAPRDLALGLAADTKTASDLATGLPAGSYERRSGHRRAMQRPICPNDADIASAHLLMRVPVCLGRVS